MSTEYLNNKAFESIIIKFQQAKKNKHKMHLLRKDLETQTQAVNSKYQTIRIPLQLTEQDVYKADADFTEAQGILAHAFYTLSQNIVRYAKLSNIDEDDSVQEGVLICFERAEKFDPDKGKAFNYMTTCILNHFRQLWRTAKNYNELKKKYNEMFQLKIGMTMQNRRHSKKNNRNKDR